SRSLVSGIRNSCREERARRCALRPEDSERAAEERVVARRHIDEVESLDDRDPRLKQGVVGRMVLVAELLDSQAVDPDQTDLLLDQEPSTRAGQVHEAGIEGGPLAPVV